MVADVGGRLRAAWDVFKFAVATIGYLLGVFSTFDIFDKLHLSDDAQKFVAVLYIVLASILIYGFLCFRFYHSDRKEKFANITPTMRSIVGRSKDLMSFLEDAQSKNPTPLSEAIAETVLRESIRQLREICDELAHVFGMLTGTHCRASIKVNTTENDGQLYVIALARDNLTTRKNPQFDDMRRRQKMDRLADNSEFLRLTQNRDPSYAYLCNDLTRRDGLSWSSINAYQFAQRPELKASKWWHLWGSRNWVLPYASTLTVAIRRNPEVVASDEPIVVGFLAVDSESRGVFRFRWDEHICASVADVLFHPVNLLLKLLPYDSNGAAASTRAAVRRRHRNSTRRRGVNVKSPQSGRRRGS